MSKKDALKNKPEAPAIVTEKAESPEINYPQAIIQLIGVLIALYAIYLGCKSL